mgnify:FL=1
MGFLDRIKKNQTLPPRVFLYGGEKLGKSTFVSQCPGVIFLPTESGLDSILEDIPPKLESYEDVRAAIKELLTLDHDYQAVAIDTTTSLERLIHAHIMQIDRVKSIVKAAGGYGNGYAMAVEMLRDILEGLDALREEKGMAVFLIGHSITKSFANPEGPAYDRWQPRGHENFNSLIIEWADIVGFVGYRERVGLEENDKTKRTVAHGIAGENGTQRVIRLDGGPSCRAGSRYKLPREIPLDWGRFEAELSKAMKRS